MTLVAILCCAIAIPMLTSCTSDNDDNPAPNPVQDNLADATIIWYGTGSGNVDADIMNNFRQFYRAKSETFDHVNIVAQYKASATLFAGMSEMEWKFIEEDLKQYEGMTDEELEDPKMVDPYDYFYLYHPQPGATYRFAVDPKKSLRTLTAPIIKAVEISNNQCQKISL